MDPVTLGTVALGSTLLSAGVGTVGAFSNASAQRDAARYQEQVARNNQIIAEQNARQAAAVGSARAQAQDFKNRAVAGSVRAAQGASGLDLESGSLSDVREGTERLGRLDTETLFNNAMTQVSADQARAMNFGAQADVAAATGRTATTQGTFGAVSSILGGASSFSDKWLRYQNVGVPGFGSAF